MHRGGEMSGVRMSMSVRENIRARECQYGELSDTLASALLYIGVTDQLIGQACDQETYAWMPQSGWINVFYQAKNAPIFNNFWKICLCVLAEEISAFPF